MIVAVSYDFGTEGQVRIAKIIEQFGQPDNPPNDCGELLWSNGSRELVDHLLMELFEGEIILFVSAEKENP
jgi:hypothetical protein